MSVASRQGVSDTDIAIVGMAGRFPGARTIDEFWRNLRSGVESIRTFSDEELLAAGVSAEELANPQYVKAGTVLDDMEMFDAGFFGFTPRDASIMDPQHRQFLECAWEALESAGHVPARFGGAIGVFGGSGFNAYLPYNLLPNRELVESVGFFLVRHTGNDKDFLTTRVSYLLDLRGPAVSVQTACSTSLVAIHLACQSLLSGETDMALAGGVTIEMPHRRGYVYHEGEILSPDGHCRAFDHRAQGTVFGSGVGVVALRRLADAIADGDHIHAVVKGSAINNDGSLKVGYLAPSVDGQAQAIEEALAVADVDPGTISYVETHGTATPVGDPIEIAALTRAFRRGTDKKGFCAVGSVKSNVGHLDTAAGVASIIKVALSLQHRELPPSLHFEQPNPTIDFASSPFYVNASLRQWIGDAPLRAGVNSLGVGGTNAHVVLEEAPVHEPSGGSRPAHLLTLSAKSPASLDAATERLAQHLASYPDANLADVAYTLHVGRTAFAHRRMVVARDAHDASTALAHRDPKRLLSQVASDGERQIAFMFPGGGAQYPDMARELYETERVFREQVDECLTILHPTLDFDLRAALFPSGGATEAAGAVLERPSRALPALFTIEYALAQLWMSWGVRPQALIGHSLGEYVAACLSGVITLQEGLALVTLRGRLFETLPDGAMLSVPLSERDIRPLLAPELSIAAVNAPNLCVVSGPAGSISALERELGGRDIDASRLHINVAAHSAMLEPILDEFGAFVRRLRPHVPTIPYVSNVTGTWITAADATDPTYWVRHLRGTVRFAEGVGELLVEPQRVLLEVGPGQTLVSLARQHAARGPTHLALPSLRHVKDPQSDVAFALGTLGRLWLAGVDVDWTAFYAGEQRRRVPLPTYAFDRQRYWIEPPRSDATREAVRGSSAGLRKRADVADWFYVPTWKQTMAPAAGASDAPGRWLLFADECGVGQQLARRLEREGHTVTVVHAGDRFDLVAASTFTVRPRVAGDYDALFAALRAHGGVPDRIAHLWAVTASEPLPTVLAAYEATQATTFHALLCLAQALGKEDLATPCRVAIVSNGMQQVAGELLRYPEKATLLGPCRVIGQEFPEISCRSIDVGVPEWGARQPDALLDQLVAELRSDATEPVVAYRGHRRFVQDFEPTRLTRPNADTTRLRAGGVYLITGGLGGIGLLVAEHLAREARAKLVLVGRTPLPPREEWEAWLARYDVDDATSLRIRKVQALEAMGAEVLVLAADVADLDSMTAALRRARERFGPVNGVVHAAGVLDDGAILLKDPAAADRVLSPKVRGALVLDAALRNTTLDFFVLFSSVSAIAGLAGQVDYAAANAFLDAYAHQRTARDGGLTVAVNWSAWQEVGMAAELARRLGIGASSPARPEGRATAHPLVETCVRETADERVYETLLSPSRHWILAEHRLRGGEALIPGTGYVELVRAALADRPEPRPVEIRDVLFTAPFVARDDDARQLRVTLSRRNGAFDFTVMSRAHAASQGWLDHARGSVGYVDAASPVPRSVDALRARCTKRVIEGADAAQSAQLRFGRRWSCLRRIAYGEGEALVTLELAAEFSDDLTQYQLHPAVLDLATAGAQALIEGYDAREDFYVPMSYGVLRMYAPLPSALHSHVRRRTGTDAKETATFDISLLDERGTVVVEISEFVMRRVRDAALMSAPSESRPQAATANRVLEVGLKEGIAPAEGIEALRRILGGSPLPQVIVSSQDLHALIATLQAPPTGAHPSQDGAGGSAIGHARPNLATTYVAPRNDEEREIAAIWQAMLGLEQVGVHDNFFELGGHSLLLTQTVARVRAKTHVDIPLSALFERATIAELAEEIDRARSAGTPRAPEMVPRSRDAYRVKRSSLAEAGTPASV
jgi:phthiocerol/phenolphthiocerol synthesis type-I polyketide synthase E